ncbi:hypothetical protein [Streptomyces sp. Ag109_G2-15]|uniref:hypothetical protein n=1 Tax=Streptomyces sp. Ag109_G2-15 TaxID=1938850 RepID=UPI000BCCEDAA|nr:hypothetical protein [Streptomyces sp. Ag109_G2-15]SOD85470.1 hypothetical protein SAMN06272765_2896 [Streptomyces sp. Ag109_G2-15]
MIRAERGATGFRAVGEAPLPEPDLASFQWACHTAARTARLRVRARDTGVAASYRAVDIGGTAVLAHCTLPVVAFTAVPVVPAGPVREFVDPPGWAGVFAEVGFRALGGEELGVGIDRVDLRDLAEAELRQVRYWRPRTLGELMFNWWD